MTGSALAGMLLLSRPVASPAFPRAAARIYLTAAEKPAVTLTGQTAGTTPSDAAVAAAEQQLRAAAADTAASPRQRMLAAYVLGRGEAAQGKTAAAAQDLATAAVWPPVRDAATADLVRLLAGSQDNQGVLAAAQRYPVAKNDPFATAVGKPAARAAAALQDWKASAEWASRFPNDPEMIWLRAQAADGLGQGHAAALLERSLIYDYPASAAARAATAAWEQRLREDPRLKADWRLVAHQAAGWNAAGKYEKAANDWALAGQMAPSRERARLLGMETRAWLQAGHLRTTATRLKRLLHMSARAEALELEVELARRKGASQDIPGPLAALRKEFPHSAWYARALHEAGNDAVLAGDDAAIEDRFDQLSRRFPQSGYAPEALWRADWTAVRRGEKDTPARLEQYLRRYPHGSAAVDALYWRGVWAEQHDDARLAQACFQAAAGHFPGTFFGQQAQKRVAKTAAATIPDPPVWLKPFVSDPPAPVAQPVPAALVVEVQRATWMQEAGLLDPAAAILAHVAYALPARASLTVARQLAAVDKERSVWNQGMVVMIRAVPHYMELQPEQLPPNDWRTLFPAPYGRDLEAVAQHFGLDRYLLLGLIRQESGFDANSLSRAFARGLMQLELDTARGRMRQLPAKWQALKGPGRLAASDLFNPSLNLALGAAELQGLLQQFEQPAYALAGYNAGASRVVAWQQQYPGLGLDGFIESVPFSQTRGYIQAVLRNQQRYREIYGEP